MRRCERLRDLHAPPPSQGVYAAPWRSYVPAMNFRWLKRLLPYGLYGRAALILIVPVVTIQLVVSFTFVQRHFEGVTEQMTRNVARGVDFLVSEVNASDSLAEAQERASRFVLPLSVEVMLPAPSAPRQDARRWIDLSGRAIIATFHEEVPAVSGVVLVDESKMVLVGLNTRFGPMQVMLSRAQVSASNPHQLLVLMVATSFLMTFVAYLFLRNQLRPIKRMAAAAEAFGRGQSVRFRPTGATEVRAAGRAFLEMRARIERHIEQRTLMLSGVSHDLRTPLTRLKLGLSLIDDPEVEELMQDVDDMERMLDAFLAFARGDALEEARPADPASLLHRVVENARRAGQDVTARPVVGEVSEAVLRPEAVRRALENLIGNAVRYGNRVEVSLEVGERSLTYRVEDDGPGIPEAERESALRAFSRLDEARNQDQGGGVGLGLTIAADIARSHGGVLHLGQSARLGGLAAELTLAR